MGSSNSLLSKIGLGALVISGLALLVTLVYVLLGAAGVITVKSAGDVTSLLTNGIIATALVFGFGLLAALLFIPGLLGSPRQGTTSFISSLVLAIVGGVLLFGVMTPRVSAGQATSDLSAFAQTAKDNCQTPLQKAVDDITATRDHAYHAATDKDAAALMTKDADTLTKDAAALGSGAFAMRAIDSTKVGSHLDLVNECITSLSGEVKFLTGKALPDLGAPLNAIFTPGMSGINLLKTGAAIASGQAPVKLPDGTVTKVVSTVFTAVADSTNPALDAAAKSLKTDLSKQIGDEVSPFGVDIADLK
jgi:hypothetical protein